MPEKVHRSKKSRKDEKHDVRPSNAAVSYDTIGVKECLVWHEPKKKKKSKKDSDGERNNRTGETIRCEKNQENNVSIPTTHKEPRSIDTGGSVSEALRGWPSLRQKPNDVLEGTDSSDGKENQEDSIRKPKATNKTKSQKGGKGSSPGHKRRAVLNEGLEDPQMADLMSHRFLYELQLQQEEERRRDEELRYDQRSSYPKSTKDIYLTKAAQLRAIHLAEKVQVQPKDLWQMPKFKNGAKAHVESFRKHDAQN